MNIEERLIELHNFLKNKLLLKSASFVLKLAGYDDEWRDLIEEHGQSNTKPFSKWFPNGDRVYIPFSIEGSYKEKGDLPVVNLLLENGYEVVDYRKGYAVKDGRTYKIGKLINKIERETIRELDEKIQTSKSEEGEETVTNLEQEKNQLKQYFSRILNLFLNSDIRKEKDTDSFYIVISQDIHDIARMSYDRPGWTSCMELGEGGHYESLFCEVANGGLVAYLVKDFDKEIDDPVARIHIRRFDNSRGDSIAIPEDSVYGENLPGFSDFVKRWIDEKNNKMPGRYKMIGGGYSDSHPDNYFVVPEIEDKESLKQWLEGDASDRYEYTFTVTDNFYDELSGYGYEYPEGTWTEDDYGSKEFRKEVDAIMFKNKLESFDYDENWMDYFIEDEYFLTKEYLRDILESNPTIGEKEAEYLAEEKVEEFIDKERENLREERFTITKDVDDYYNDIFNKLGNKIMNNIQNIDKSILDIFFKRIDEFLKDKNGWNNMEDIFLKYFKLFPSKITKENLENASSYKIKNLSKTWLGKNKQFISIVKELMYDIMEKYDIKVYYSCVINYAEALQGNLTLKDYLFLKSKLEKGMDLEYKAPYILNTLFSSNQNIFSKEIIEDAIDTSMKYYAKSATNNHLNINIYTIQNVLHKAGKYAKKYLSVFEEQLENIDKYVEKAYNRNSVYGKVYYANDLNKQKNLLNKTIEYLRNL